MTSEYVDAVVKLLENKSYWRLAIDGRCGAGKTTLASALEKRFDCTVVHLDDFFLPRGMKKDGYGNLEKTRLLQEVLLPMAAGEAFSYRVFSCCEQRYTHRVDVPQNKCVIVEGSYALLQEFRFAYTDSVFLTLSPFEQEKRIITRNGLDGYAAFRDRWIPDEEQYICAQAVIQYADLILQ